jgi:hypothetical protein
MKSRPQPKLNRSKFSTTKVILTPASARFQHLYAQAIFDKFDGHVGVTSIIVNKMPIR